MLKLSNSETISSFMGGGPHTHTLSYTSVGNVLLKTELKRYEVKDTFWFNTLCISFLFDIFNINLRKLGCLLSSFSWARVIGWMSSRFVTARYIEKIKLLKGLLLRMGSFSNIMLVSSGLVLSSNVLNRRSMRSQKG